MSETMELFEKADAYVEEHYREDMSDEDLLELVKGEVAMVYDPRDMIHSLWRIGTLADQKPSLDKLRIGYAEMIAKRREARA